MKPIMFANRPAFQCDMCGSIEVKLIFMDKTYDKFIYSKRFNYVSDEFVEFKKENGKMKSRVIKEYMFCECKICGHKWRNKTLKEMKESINGKRNIQ